MALYPNGRYPLGMFVHLGGDLYLSPSLNARWNEAVRLGIEKYGVRLHITGPSPRGWDGANGYRWLEKQVQYKSAFGIWAAYPGASSHGGSYRGREVFALDVANWRDLAYGNQSLAWARFVALMRVVGLTTDFVSPREEWHVGDFNNAWVVPSFGHIQVNPDATNRHEEEMTDKYCYYTDGATVMNAIYNTGSGYFQQFQSSNGEYNTAKLRGHGISVSFQVSKSDFDSIKSACAEVRPK